MSTQEITFSKNQYTLWQILGIWSLAAIPMGILSWVVYPAVVYDFGSDPFGSGVARIVLGLGVLSALLTAGALVYTVLAWKNRYWGLASRLYYTLGTVAAVAYVWFLNYWNLLGWRY